MDIEGLYIKIQSQLDQKLPFVVYQKAGERIIHAMLQSDDSIYETRSYDESGFVFAPFDSTAKSILIPLAKSIQYSIIIPEEPERPKASGDKIDALTDNSVAKEKHIKLVNSGIDAINSGLLKKVVVSRKEEITVASNRVLSIFKKLIDSYPKAFVYCWYHPQIGTWLGATPETLLKVTDNKLFTMALAGTLPYIDAIEVDWGVKEIEEQSMVKDFVTKELSSIVDNIKHSETYSHKAGTLLHLRTDITGDLQPGNFGIKDVINVLHPTPAVCGLPKKEAKSFILEKENYTRKYYTGFLGELNISQNGVISSTIVVNLRCMEIESDKAIIYVGGGITKDSIPEKEWEETVRKTVTMKKVLQ
ncbi:isochorismate synthase [Aquimarina sp. RZ0]|uniref:isochorismate synthase n=1 Tax=Aquimarina sp. RZ0 TaxID=2607730 RepID=UPI0011F3AC52|nr:isochorismate synthase [Aquimarina sp. RZ0]KAA1245055.1 isochorismate synthase [Aquimarina sp. RZ0]